MYSCGTSKRESVVLVGGVAWPGFKSVEKCRFDQRYTELHQKAGCKSCAREWDFEYLKRMGLWHG